MRLVEFFALCGLVIGWLATHLFSEARERRKEARAQLDKLIDRIAKFENDSASFHTAQIFDAAKNGALLSDFDRIQRVLHRMPLVPNIDQLSGLLIGLRRAVTLKNFDASTFSSESPGSDLLVGIVQAGRDLEDRLEGFYLSRYPSGFPYFDWRNSRKRVKLFILVALALTVSGAYFGVDWRGKPEPKQTDLAPVVRTP